MRIGGPVLPLQAAAAQVMSAASQRTDEGIPCTVSPRLHSVKSESFIAG
jgi:hypothetical protein